MRSLLYFPDSRVSIRDPIERRSGNRIWRFRKVTWLHLEGGKQRKRFRQNLHVKESRETAFGPAQQVWAGPSRNIRLSGPVNPGHPVMSSKCWPSMSPAIKNNRRQDEQDLQDEDARGGPFGHPQQIWAGPLRNIRLSGPVNPGHPVTPSGRWPSMSPAIENSRRQDEQDSQDEDAREGSFGRARQIWAGPSRNIRLSGPVNPGHPVTPSGRWPAMSPAIENSRRLDEQDSQDEDARGGRLDWDRSLWLNPIPCERDHT